MGFSVHITHNDEVIIYNGTFPFFRSGRMSMAEFETVLTQYTGMLEGNPLGVLVTSQHDLQTSSIFPQVMELLFKPYVQVFYCKRP